jgi:4-diphosphocytidyl-2-C-methyl-D-erythritol kinase
MDKINLPAPAKLNLFLHITGQRADGYHLLQTVFQMLDFADEIELIRRDDGIISRLKENQDIPIESDLCLRAAKQLQTRYGAKFGVDINLTKNLPIGGGIGGGSSDAATVLHGLNLLWELDLSIEKLAEVGLELGADVPVFVHGFSAWAEGIGELLTPIKLPKQWFVVIQPEVSVSTAKIFSDQALTRDCEALTIARFQNKSGCENCSNVFQPIVIKKYPQIAKAMDWLSFFSEARLTGTGSCIFASFETKLEAEQVLIALAQTPEKWQGFIAKGLNQSPLLSAVNALAIN